MTNSPTFWDYALAGMLSMVNGLLDMLPFHEPIDLGTPDSTLFGPVFRLVFTLVKLSNLNFGMVAMIVTLIFGLEAARWIYAGYMWVKRAIPVIG